MNKFYTAVNNAKLTAKMRVDLLAAKTEEDAKAILSVALQEDYDRDLDWLWSMLPSSRLMVKAKAKELGISDEE